MKTYTVNRMREDDCYQVAEVLRLTVEAEKGSEAAEILESYGFEVIGWNEELGFIDVA